MATYSLYGAVNASIEETKTISLGEITLDENMRTVTAGGNNVELTYKEYELLKLLLSHPGLVYSRQQILEKFGALISRWIRGR